jgi:hypothetical protein
MATPSVTDIRNLLDQLAAKQVTSNTITANIADALIYINRFASDTSDIDEKDYAQKRIAVWLSYISYAEGQSFSQGATPLFSQEKATSYRDIAELALNFVSEEPVDLEDIRRTNQDDNKAGLPTISFTGTTAFE